MFVKLTDKHGTFFKTVNIRIQDICFCKLPVFFSFSGYVGILYLHNCGKRYRSIVQTENNNFRQVKNGDDFFIPVL